MGAQVLRVLCSSGAYFLRDKLQSWPKTNFTTMLRKQGFIIIPNFLSNESFKKVKDEYFNATNIGLYTPIKDGNTIVERYTFSLSQWKTLPGLSELLSNRLLIKTLESAELKNIEIGDVWFDTIHYDESQKIASSQNQLHSDTFYNTHKVWFFIETVNIEDGPIYFVPGTNNLSMKRLVFEYNKSINFKELNDYSFRVEQKDRVFLGCKEEAIICPANTLVIANTRGLHRRGKGKAGNTRKQIHFCIRTNNPFSLL
tara:strand:- start:944 stop:1711 length:768 start_codon:yes stop_codon:yes gene_type:complete